MKPPLLLTLLLVASLVQLAVASRPISPREYVSGQLREIHRCWLLRQNEVNYLGQPVRADAPFRVDAEAFREAGLPPERRVTDAFSPTLRHRRRIASFCYEAGGFVVVGSLIYWLYVATRRQRTLGDLATGMILFAMGLALFVPRWVGLGDGPPPSYAFLDDYQIFARRGLSSGLEFLAIERADLRPGSPSLVGITVGGVTKEIPRDSVSKLQLDTRPEPGPRRSMEPASGI